MQKMSSKAKRAKFIRGGMGVNHSCICRGHCVCSKQATDPKMN